MKTTGTLPNHRRVSALLAVGVLISFVLLVNACGTGVGRPLQGSGDQSVIPWATATLTRTPQPTPTEPPHIRPTFASFFFFYVI